MAESYAKNYGNLYWCIKTDLSNETGEIYAFADKVLMDPTGCLVLLHRGDGGEYPTLVFASGEWHAFYAASQFDGAPVAVEHWKGKVNS